MDSSNKAPDHTVSTVLFWVGGILTFLGFIWPGWVSIELTPGDVEMLPLAAITLVGLVGVVILVAAVLKRVHENRVLRQK